LACPYFVPREIVYDLSWPHPARLPLGAGWTGTCCAANHKSANGADVSTVADSIITANIPDSNLPDPPASSLAATLAVDSAIIRDFCNLGYATGCPHLPITRDWDAIRFTIAGSARNQITLCYVCEFAHAPRAHGTLTYDLIAEAWCEAPGAAVNKAPADAAAPVNTAVTASAAGDPRVRRLAASYLHAYRVRQSVGQSFGHADEHTDEQSDVQTGAPA